MSEWKEYRLGDICETNKSQYSNKENWHHFKYLDTGNITKGNIDNIQEFDSFESLPSRARRKVTDGDIIYSSVRPNQEHYGYISNPSADILVSTGFIVISANKDIINPIFLYNYLTQPKITKYLQAIGEQSVCTYPAIKPSDIEDLVIKIPSLDIQAIIASILSYLDSKIENNRKICANLEAQAQALFKHWFIDFAPFKDGKFVESELGMIPEGWRVGTFGDVVEQITDKVKDRKDIKVLSPINSGELVLSDEYFTKQVYSKSIEKYILVKPLDFAYNPARVNIGSIGMNEFDFDGCVSPVYVVFRCIPEYHFYIDMVRKGAYFKRNVNKLAIGGVRQTLRYEDLSRINLIIPPLSIIRDYNTFHYKIKESVKHLIQENLRLSTLRDTLLPKLMSGEIKV